MLTTEEKAAWIAEREARNQKIKDRIRAAGISYPMGWDEMGSSEKDLWEDRMIRSIERREGRRK